MIANWHRIKCIDTEEGKKFEGELPVCDDKTGEAKVIVVCAVGHFKSDFTDEYLSEDEDEFIIESYEVYNDIYRAAHGDTPAHFVKHLSDFIVAWDYAPDFMAESSQTEKENPCNECLCNVDEYCRCEKLSLYESYQQGRADEQLRSIESAKEQAKEYRVALEKGKADEAREFAEWLQYGQHDFCVVDYDNRLETVPFEIILAEWQKGLENESIDT